MLVLLIVCAAALATVLLTIFHLYQAALGVGVVAGAFFFLRGVGKGGGPGNSAGIFQREQDIETRIGICLACGGIAAEAIGLHSDSVAHMFPLSFRIFYGVCLGVAAIGAVGLAVKASKRTNGNGSS